jgi:toxin ParE1/3/4
VSVAVSIQPRADADLVEVAAFLAQDSIDVALRFLANARSTIDGLIENPHIGPRFRGVSDRLVEVRYIPVKGFERHLVFYQATKDQVRILRVLHGARDLPVELQES